MNHWIVRKKNITMSLRQKKLIDENDENDEEVILND